VRETRTMPLPRVLLLPGGGLPADLAYAQLLEALDGAVEAVVKDLEMFAGPEPPPDYELEHELDAIARVAEAHGWDRFHLVGYSSGGAFGLAFTAARPTRVASLALIEPAWAGNEGLSEGEEAISREYERIASLPADELQQPFVRIQLAPGVEPPPEPEGPPPPWAANRPAGLKAVIPAMRRHRLDLEALAAFRRPVYYALGGRSNPVQYERMAERLAGVFPDFTLERFPERHHFDPPHRAEPERLAASLLAVWRKAER
jgi:pimeloyl-ACP methyl ester carboxylesterase